jgi:hypothetical protein
MADTKPEFLEAFFNLIETQVQFGDSKASLLVAGDAILLAVTGGLIKMVSGCQANDFTVSCVVPSVSLGLAVTAAALLTLSMVLSLLAARPSPIHDQPRTELFLLSSIARMERDEFVDNYLEASRDDLIREALISVHGKADYGTKKFHRLKQAIDATLLSLGFIVATLVAAICARVLS